MTAVLATTERPAIGAQPPTQRWQADIERAIDGACARIAPLWPLRNFVAVNPFLGFTHLSFEASCAALRRIAAVDMLMPRDFYRAALADGTIEHRDIDAALSTVPGDSGGPERIAAICQEILGDRPPPPRSGRIATVAEILDRLAAGDRQASRTAFMIDEISKWCAAYFDEHQSVWRLPSRDLPLYAAWRAAMRFDRNPEMMGIRGFRAAVAAMPDDPGAAIAEVAAALGIPPAAVEDYLHRALIDIGGWAAFVRQRVWNSALDGRADDMLRQLLAVRVVWGYALFRERRDPVFIDAWRAAMAAAAHPSAAIGKGDDAGLAADIILQRAYEGAYQRRLLARLAAPAQSAAAPVSAARSPLQAVFCIDVRSEIYRRALETACPGAETLGFAGFFGFPIEYVPIGVATGTTQCPVLLKPAVTVCETVDGAAVGEEDAVATLRQIRRRAAKAWKSFKMSAVSSFTYVEATGLFFAAKIVGDSLGLTRTVSDARIDGLDRDIAGRLAPRIEARRVDGRETGFDDARQLDMAEAALRGMSLTQDFARLVLLAGHGSTTVNNPHAASLDCGACGGHGGGPNARVAAAILNRPWVREGLRARGLAIPDDTVFLACLHDTTTDEVTLFGADSVPATHRAELAQLRAWLSRASTLARAERAAQFGMAGDGRADRAIVRRSRDWSQVRPEWGLAGNAAFIAGPRRFTAGISLGGRAFLHSYDWRADPDFRILEMIMTAPMIVASWINLQYYGSTVNNSVFGAGNKTLHNVAGAIGVLEGNAGDLRTGLPIQSVHDGARFVHEPLRLNVFIAAPVTAINEIIARHAQVRALADNRWLHLFAVADCGRVSHRYANALVWEPLP